MPLVTRAEAPAELQSTPLSDKFFLSNAAKFATFNEQCAVELKEMNYNVIGNIVARGGDQGWTRAENFDYLKKTFEFPSFEQTNAFCQAVAKRSNLMDHHPEWTLKNGGCSVDVTLTSHFAGNKVTRLDFELAEAMNDEFTIVNNTYQMFPRIN
jgi:4a-hydroxytetrahydrobiopterin dehydratase